MCVCVYKMHTWITLLYTWNLHNIVNQQYFNNFFFNEWIEEAQGQMAEENLGSVDLSEGSMGWGRAWVARGQRVLVFVEDDSGKQESRLSGSKAQEYSTL